MLLLQRFSLGMELEVNQVVGKSCWFYMMIRPGGRGNEGRGIDRERAFLVVELRKTSRRLEMRLRLNIV